MAKKRKTPNRKKGERQARLIDNIPTYSQQRRSSPPKRRTDFSSLFCYSYSIAHRGTAALPRLSLNEVGSSKLRVNHSDNSNEALSSSSLVKCSNSSHGEELSQCSSPDEMQSDECPLSNSSCKAVSKRKGISKISYPVRKKLPADSESNSLSGTPENVRLWSTECFEERCSNTTVEFQDQSCDKGSSSNSSRIEDNDLNRGRGKRERKPKVPFDEETTISLKSTRKFRRMRIMRYLGLAAPVGSPFSPIA